MKAILDQHDGNAQEIDFGEYTRIKFHLNGRDEFIEVSVGTGYNGEPCLDLRSGWTGLTIEPVVSNSIKVRLTERMGIKS